MARWPESSPAGSIARWVEDRRKAVLIAMLSLLHLALVQGPENGLGRTLMMVHFGMFLLWQPLVRSEIRLAILHLVGLSVVMVLAIVWLNWALMAFWLMVLAGLVGGRVFFHHRRWVRVFFLLALIYLVTVLLLWAVPKAVPEMGYADDIVQILRRYALPLLLLAMALVPVGKAEDKSEGAIDLAYTVFLVFLLIALTQSTVVYTLLRKQDYLSSLFSVVFLAAAVLMLVSWIWSPRAGFSGLSAIASRYALSIGLPLEQWLHSLTDLYERESDPLRLLDGACLYMVRNLPWVAGGVWRAGGHEGTFGAAAKVRSDFQYEGLNLVLYTMHELSPSVRWHFDLVAQLLAHFFRAKESDRELREMAYIQAVHETGARLTHDVKNLLQSLNTLVFAAQNESDSGSTAYQSLLRRQLPALSRRLEQTLAKLKDPDSGSSERIPVSEWWREMQRTNAFSEAVFVVEGEVKELRIPGALFSHAAENLLQNAFDKKVVEVGVTVTLILRFLDAGRVSLTVTDTGSPVPSRISDDIGIRPVVSEKGFGIGLYQLARSAALSGYQLVLRTNEPGCVTWVLEPV